MITAEFFKTSERFKESKVSRSAFREVWAALESKMDVCPADMSFSFDKPEAMTDGALRVRVSKKAKEMGVKFRVIKHETEGKTVFEIGRVGVN